MESKPLASNPAPGGCDGRSSSHHARPHGDGVSLPRAIREHVTARDGGRCSVPGCTNRAFLEADHLKGRGNGHSVDEIQELCGSHHRARHKGLLRVEGVGADRRFYLADGTYMGRAGDRVRADLKTPASFAPANSGRETGPESTGVPLGFAAANSPPQPQARDEVADAVKAYIVLGGSERKALAVVQRALEEKPHLAEAEADKVLHAMLIRH